MSRNANVTATQPDPALPTKTATVTTTNRPTTQVAPQPAEDAPYDGVRLRKSVIKTPWQGMTEKEVHDELNKWKNEPIKLRSFLTDEDIYDCFVGEDLSAHDELSHKFISGGLKLVNGILNLDVAGGFLAASMDLFVDMVKDKAIDIAAETGFKGAKTAWMGVLPDDEAKNGWTEWKDSDSKSTSNKKLFKRIGTSVLAIGIKMAIAGGVLAGTVATAGAAAIPIILAIGWYFGDKANDTMRKMRVDMAVSAIERYDQIKQKSMQRLEKRRQQQQERIIMINARHDHEDIELYIVAEYWSYYEKRSKPITRWHLNDLESLCPRAGKLSDLHKAEVWLKNRGIISRGVRNDVEVLNGTALALEEYKLIDAEVEMAVDEEKHQIAADEFHSTVTVPKFVTKDNMAGKSQKRFVNPQ